MTAELASEFAKATCADGLAESVSARSASSQGAVGEWAPSVPPVAREDEHASTTILMLARISRLVNGFAFNWIAGAGPIAPAPLCASLCSAPRG